MASRRVDEILHAAWAGSPDGSDLPTRLAAACVRALPVSGVGLALMTDEGPAGTIAATDGPRAGAGGTAVHPRGRAVRGRLADRAAGAAARPGPHRRRCAGRRSPEARWRPASARSSRSRCGWAPSALGVLDLYRDRAGSLSADELTEALSFADAATLLLLHLQARAARDGPLGSIPVLDDRAEVHQATGVVSVQAACRLARRWSCCAPGPTPSTGPSVTWHETCSTGWCDFRPEVDDVGRDPNAGPDPVDRGRGTHGAGATAGARSSSSWRTPWSSSSTSSTSCRCSPSAAWNWSTPTPPG